MSHRLATLSAQVTTGVIAGELAALAAGEKAPDWIKVTPTGRVPTRDGRSYAFDPAVLVARFKSDGINIPVDLDHSVTLKSAVGESGTIAGWVVELAARPDGTYARVDWLEAGKVTLAARTHRFISPTFHHDADNAATWLHSVALVPAPALAMPAVASAGGSQEKPQMLKNVAVALGLAEAADEAACLTAITGLKTPKDMVAKAVHDQALANLAAVTAAKDQAEGKLATLAAETHKKKVDDLLEKALGEKKIVPAQRDAYAAMCATEVGLTQVTALLAATTPGLRASGLDEIEVPAGGGDVNPAALAAEAVAYQKKMAAAGVIVSTSDAVHAVAKKEGKN